eukprot:2219344-Pyramimonas_sp.AAC.1
MAHNSMLDQRISSIVKHLGASTVAKKAFKTDQGRIAPMEEETGDDNIEESVTKQAIAVVDQALVAAGGASGAAAPPVSAAACSSSSSPPPFPPHPPVAGLPTAEEVARAGALPAGAANRSGEPVLVVE